MTKTVRIFDKSTGVLIATYEVELRGLNYDPAGYEYFELAFDDAVEDGLLNEDQRPFVRFEFG